MGGGGDVRDSGGNVRNSGDIEYGLGNSRVEIVINKSAYITFEDTWNNMYKAHWELIYLEK